MSNFKVGDSIISILGGDFEGKIISMKDDVITINWFKGADKISEHDDFWLKMHYMVKKNKVKTHPLTTIFK